MTKKKYYNPDYKKYYDSATEFVESLGKECIEATLFHDYANYDKEVMLAIKKKYPDFFKKYPKAFNRVLLHN